MTISSNIYSLLQVENCFIYLLNAAHGTFSSKMNRNKNSKTNRTRKFKIRGKLAEKI